MERTHLTRARLGILLAVAAGVVLGAIFGQPGSSRAATSVVPKNKTLPTISGAVAVGQTLVGSRGTWSGSPTSFHFQWSRCDGTGAACLAISGATGRIYTITNADVNDALRLTVTARNASGATDATSAATTPVPVSGCPFGTGTIPIADVSAPARLQIVAASLSPSLTRSTNTIRLRFKVEACGRPVQGASVFASAIPYNQFASLQAATGADGTVTLTEARRSGFPASQHQRLLAVFARASKPGESPTSGVSTSRVVAFRFAHH
jgi:hypothetical protein